MTRPSVPGSAVISLITIVAIVLPIYAAEPIAAGATNIAAAENGGHIVAFSSQALDENGRVMPEWQVTNLIDGKHVVGNYTPAESYGWSSQSAPSEENPEWIIIGFAEERTRLLRRIVIDPQTDDPSFIGRWVRWFQLQVSTTTRDGPYKTVGSFLVDNRSVQQAFDFMPVEARYVRILVTTNHGSDKCVEMGEVAIYEAIVADSVIDDLIIRLENLLGELKRYRDFQLYQQEQQSLEAATTKPEPPAGTTGAGGD